MALYRCPVCDQRMYVKKRDLGYAPNRKLYDREVYWCRKDDVWITVEVPKIEEKA